MLIFGHIGITLGIFLMLSFLVPGIRSRIYLRYIAFGSLLPDIIDKPIGRVLFAESIANGRIIAHTLIFAILLLLIGYYFYKTRADSRFAMISVASFCHLLEDQMWTQPATFYWPILGWGFPHDPSYGNGFAYLFTMLSRSFSVDISHVLNFEFAGFIVIVLVIINYFRKK